VLVSRESNLSND